MIVRIMGEGQYDVPDDQLSVLDALDDSLEDAITNDDDAGFRAALVALLDRVRGVGAELPDDALVPSDLVLPGPDAHVEDVRGMLGDEGLIPG